MLQTVFGWTLLQAGLGFLPMSAVNFAFAMSVPRLSKRISGAVLLTAGVLLTLAGMVWLSRIGAGSDYLTAVALRWSSSAAGRASLSRR